MAVCDLCQVMLLHMARVSGLGELAQVQAESEQAIDGAIRLAGPDALLEAKRSIARKGLIPPEHLGVDASPEVWAGLPFPMRGRAESP